MVNDPADIQPAILIEGMRQDWPGGARILTPQPADREPDRQAFWFSAQAGDIEVCFRLTLEAIHRMPEEAPQARGVRLVDALIAWLQDNPEHQLTPRSHFRVCVSDDGETSVEPWQPAA